MIQCFPQTRHILLNKRKKSKSFLTKIIVSGTSYSSIIRTYKNEVYRTRFLQKQTASSLIKHLCLFIVIQIPGYTWNSFRPGDADCSRPESWVHKDCELKTLIHSKKERVLKEVLQPVRSRCVRYK